MLNDSKIIVLSEKIVQRVYIWKDIIEVSEKEDGGQESKWEKVSEVM